ncbi:MAG TPA: adenine phosphoribosyltransferase [Bacteroidota bacterium]|nr:adenine phosphoribosyltransferase [Bacteroidota bacterium]
MSDLASYIRNVPDFPKKGVIFRDITTLLKEPDAFKKAVATLYERYNGAKIHKVVGVESRGFILGAALALRLGVGFVPIRKKGKLPAETVREEYSLEYGKDSIEIHKDAIEKGDRVLIHDDLLATGGTIGAASKLVERVGGNIVGLCFLVELTFLKGRDRLANYDVFSLIQYDKE